MAALGTGITPSKPLDRMAADITRDEGLFTRRQEELTQRQTQIAEEREKTLAPLEQQLSERMAEPTPKRPPSDIPQFQPKPVIDAKDYEALSYGLIAMAMIGGVASQGRWLEVGAALNGALDGYLKGNLQLAQKHYQDYEQQFKGAVAKEAQANREFEDILRDRHMRIQDQINQYRIVAAKYDRQDALVAAQSRSLDAMWRSLESRKTALARLEENHNNAAGLLALRRDVLDSKKPTQAGTAGLSERYQTDPTYKKNVDYWAALLQMGGNLPARFAQSGAGKLMMPDILQVVPTIGGGNPADMTANRLSQRELTAEANKIGTQAAAVKIATAELKRFIPPAEEAVAAVPRTAWRPINELIQKGENTWSPEQGRLVLANRSVLNAFAQLIQRGAPTVHSLSEAEALLNTADSPAVYKAKMKQLMVEAEQAEAGLQDAREEMLKRARGMGGSSGERAPGGVPTKNAKGWLLYTDAQGNQAYVGPNNEIEEVR